MNVLMDYTIEELSKLFAERNMPSFRAKQVFEWFARGFDFSEMSNLDKKTREALEGEFIGFPLSCEREFVSKDGTKKYLLRLHDGNLVECVLMHYKYGNTICISTQVGCRMGCAFCASGMDGLKRNLTAGEMLAAVAFVNRANGGNLKTRAVTNIVLMGSGEPFDNYDNVMRFLSLVSDERGLNVSKRNISLSTCGLVPEMRRFAEEENGVTLTVSLHNPFDEGRRRIMPVARKYSVAEVMDAARYYFRKTGRRVCFEYTLIRGENTSEAHARELKKLTQGFSAHVNCILLNPVKGKSLSAISRADAEAFVAHLNEIGVSATLRRQMGVDIEGACGQLKRRYDSELGEKDQEN